MLQEHHSEVIEDQCSCLVQQVMQKPSANTSVHKEWNKWQ